jgi:mono/diheme cytochrome c family protein
MRLSQRLLGAMTFVAVAGVIQATSLVARGADSTEAAAIFNQRCTACHTFGHGVKVGPDLKGVTVRRQRQWIRNFVRGSSTVIAGGDPTAAALFEQFKQQRMPDWSDLSEAQVDAIMEWFASDGPEHQQPPEERPARLASVAEIDAGRAWFAGRMRLSSGGVACGDCHRIKDDAVGFGGSLGPDLTGVYARYQDRALTAFLRRPCLARVPDSAADPYLSPDEMFALKAYLRSVAMSNTSKGATP